MQCLLNGALFAPHEQWHPRLMQDATRNLRQPLPVQVSCSTGEEAPAGAGWVAGMLCTEQDLMQADSQDCMYLTLGGDTVVVSHRVNK